MVTGEGAAITEAAFTENNALGEACAAFKADWQKAPQRAPSGSGRAARLVASSVNCTQFSAAALVASPTNIQVLSRLGSAGKSFVYAWHFACSPTMQYVGAETSLLGSVKWTIEGEREIIMARLDELEKHCKQCAPPGTLVGLSRCQNMLSECGKEHLPGLKKSVSVYRCIAGPNTLCYTPAGFLVVERSLKEEDILGIRWVTLPPSALAASQSGSSGDNTGNDVVPSFLKLCKFVIPPSGVCIGTLVVAGKVCKLLKDQNEEEKKDGAGNTD